MNNNKKRTLFISVLLLIFSSCIAGCYTFSEDLRGDLVGKITLRNTDQPIDNVEITIESLWDSSYFVIHSDENGNFSLNDVHFGVNKIVFKKKDYYILTKYADIRADDTFLLNVEMLKFAPAITIYPMIQVIDSTTDLPIENAMVDVYVRDDDIYWNFYNSEYTDEEGKAVFLVGSLTRKDTIEVEARISAQGYQNGILNFTAYYQKHQPLQVFYMTPEDY